jgi:hypothetical protein
MTMAFLTGKQVADEVNYRVNGRLPFPKIITYANRALALISAASSFKWDFLIYGNQTATGGTFTPGVPIDPGKKISVFNYATQTPVALITQDEISTSVAGYVDQTLTEYNGFFLRYTAGVGAIIQCLPFSLTSGIDVYFHALPPVLTYSDVPTVRWDVPFMDNILIDLTEAFVSRVFDWKRADALEQNAQSRLIEAAKIYSTERINTGPPEESQAAEQEKLTLGRV